MKHISIIGMTIGWVPVRSRHVQTQPIKMSESNSNPAERGVLFFFSFLFFFKETDYYMIDLFVYVDFDVI